ncbi:relaxase/mobilization nuclease domain-containing protein [Litorimonas haliclonae]|uniref:relaxase/mobilization nuclease domain-containing protein n=1 Tax=Litorimonas haliclonae TaxID=2081977 RepID=UPI0039EF5BC1
MIMIGHSRGNGQNLARHLLSSENEHVTVHDVSGFACDDLHGAFKEAEAFSRGTKCQKYLYSLSLNPPAKENVETKDFEITIARVEETLGLAGQPRAIVFHEKEDRRHCHVVWSRVDTEKMKAIALSFPKRKLNALAKDIFLEKGWELPKGFLSPHLRDPKNFTLEEWQQAKRQGKDPREIKAILQSCWKQSDSKPAFENSLNGYGYRLARGDSRGYVATDMNGEVYSLSRYANVKTINLKQKLGDRKELPSVEQAQAQLATEIIPNLKKLYNEQSDKIEKLDSSYLRMRSQLTRMHKKQRSEQKFMQEKRSIAESKTRQERFNKGLRGLFDRIIGAYSKTKRENEFQAYQGVLRDQKQRDTLIFKHLRQKRELTERMSKQLKTPNQSYKALGAEIKRLNKIVRNGLER